MRTVREVFRVRGNFREPAEILVISSRPGYRYWIFRRFPSMFSDAKRRAGNKVTAKRRCVLRKTNLVRDKFPKTD